MANRPAAAQGNRRTVRIPFGGGMENEGDPGLDNRGRVVAVGFVADESVRAAQTGVCQVIKNLEYIDDGLYARQPFVGDYAPNETPLGFFLWEDRTARLLRLGAITESGSDGKLIFKDENGGETWAAVGAPGVVDALPVSAYANYRGTVYFCLNDGVAVPQSTFSYDGAVVLRSAAVPGLTARLVVVFNERVHYGNIELVVVNQLTEDPLSAGTPYDPTLWTRTNVAATQAQMTVGGRVVRVWRISPTAATGAKLELGGAFEVTASADPTKLQILVMLAGVDATYRMPMTVSLLFRGLPWQAGGDFALGMRRHPVTPNGYVYVCSQGGTSGGSEPAWPEPTRVSALTITAGGTGYTSAPTVTLSAPPAGGTQATATATVAAGVVTALAITNVGRGYLTAPTVAFSGGAGSGAAATAALMAPIGVEVTDNTAKWKCESTDVIVSQPIEVPSATDQGDPVSIYIPATIPSVIGSYVCMLRYAFGTASNPSVSLLPVMFSLDGGNAGGSPVNAPLVLEQLKRNFAQQITTTAYEYPFAPVSPATFRYPDRGVWTEPGEPDVIFAQNTVNVVEAPGELTASIVAAARLWYAKRRAMWSYVGNAQDPNLPILRDRVYVGVGSIGPRAIDVLDDIVFTIGEHQVYAFDANAGPFSAQELLPEGLRRTVMGRGASWVESIAAPASGQAYMAILRVHPIRRQLWVHTQDRKIFVYDLGGKRWSWFEIMGTSGAVRIRDIEFNPTTGRMMVMAVENGIVRQVLREESSTVLQIVMSAGGASYATPPTVAIAAPPTGGTQATATATVAAGVVTAVTVTNAGKGYVVPPVVTFSGGGGSGAAAAAKLSTRDQDRSKALYDVEKRMRPRPFEARPQRMVVTAEEVAIYGRIMFDQTEATCEMDVSFDGGDTFTKYNRVRLFPVSAGAKRRYPVPVRKTGESLTVEIAHNGPTGNDVFNVLDIDAQIIVRGPEQPATRPKAVAKDL